MKKWDDDIRYQEALRRYQVDVGEYEKAVHEYRIQLQSVGEDGIRPARPIPPIPPMRPTKIRIPKQPAPPEGFNDGVEAAALALESVGERELAAWVRRQRR